MGLQRESGLNQDASTEASRGVYSFESRFEPPLSTCTDMNVEPAEIGENSMRYENKVTRASNDFKKVSGACPHLLTLPQDCFSCVAHRRRIMQSAHVIPGTDCPIRALAAKQDK